MEEDRREANLLLDDGWFLPLDILRLELGQKALPVFIGHGRILGQFPLDHQGFDVVDGMHIVDAVHNHFSSSL